MRPVPRITMAAALAISWGSMLAHNLYELPLGPLDPENSGPWSSPSRWRWRMRPGRTPS